MKWKLIHQEEHDIIENIGGKNLSYNPNLGIQIIEEDGFAFKDLNQSGKLEPFKDWRLPLMTRIEDFTNRFTLWQEGDKLYYRRGRITIPKEMVEELHRYGDLLMENCKDTLNEKERKCLKDNDLLAVLLLMFDNDYATGKEDYLLQLIMQSMELGVLENVMYSIWEALRRYMSLHSTRKLAFL